MIREKSATSHLESFSQRLGHVVLVELPAWQLLVLAAVVGALWAASLFDWGFISGQHAFWKFPIGIDMQLVLAAYFYYVQAPWQLPLFYVSGLGTPAGTNIIFTDAVPIVGLVGKLIHSFTGATPNLYGAYLFLCFALPGIMMTLVLIATETRCALAAIIGAIFANAMPALLWRWGDIALASHFLLIGALALYLFSLQKRVWRGLAALWTAWLVLVYLTNIYLFTMVGAVWLCATIQRRLNGLTTTREAMRIATLTVTVVTIVVVLGGQFGKGGGLPFAEYGKYSMNLLSPVLPQLSGLLPGLGGIIDATGGQYEGFNYLGLGLLLASIFALPAEIGWVRRNLRRHVSLLALCTALCFFAISHRVFVGHWLLLELPLPSALNLVLGIFRSSGRFFWLIGYAQIAMVVVLAFRRPQAVIVLYLLGAALLQLLDVQPLRQHIIASIAAGTDKEEFDHNQIAHLVTGARSIEVAPSFQCSANMQQISANMELMLAAARANVLTNTVYLARESYNLTLYDVLHAPSRFFDMLRVRANAYCNDEIERARRGGDPGTVVVLLSDRPKRQDMASDITCLPLSWARYCERFKE